MKTDLNYFKLPVWGEGGRRRNRMSFIFEPRKRNDAYRVQMNILNSRSESKYFVIFEVRRDFGERKIIGLVVERKNFSV